MLKTGILFIFTFLLSILVVPLFIRLSHRLGVLDHPEDRKIHNSAIPTLGGMAIFISFLIVFVLLVGLEGSEVIYLIAGCIIVVLTGLIDDLFSLGSWKVMGQLLAVLIIIRGGFVVTSLGNIFGFGDIVLGSFSIPFTVFASLGIINALNLIDGLDGLAGGISILAFVCMLIIGNTILTQHLFLLCVCASGATLGFLIFNFNPAKIFMGDAGSNLLGLLLVSFSIMLSGNTKTVVEPIVPVVLLFIPIFDTLLVMVKRLAHARSPFAASNDHIHHKLLALGLSQKQVWVILIVVALIMDSLVIAAYRSVPPYVFTSLVFIVVLLLFGGVEYIYEKRHKGGRCAEVF